MFLFGEKCGLVTNKCNPGVGAVPVNVIMIVLQIGPTYQTCIYFAEKLMVLRCYDHNHLLSIAATSLCFKGGGVLVEIQGNIFLMNFELLTFPCREMTKLSIHIYTSRVTRLRPE